MKGQFGEGRFREQSKIGLHRLYVGNGTHRKSALATEEPDRHEAKITNSNTNELPASLGDICKIVHRAKCAIIRAHQDSSRSYDEICCTILKRCEFVLNDLRPAVLSNKHLTSPNRKINGCSRWKKVFLRLKSKGLIKARREQDKIVSESNSNSKEGLPVEEKLIHETEITDIHKVYD